MCGESESERERERGRGGKKEVALQRLQQIPAAVVPGGHASKGHNRRGCWCQPVTVHLAIVTPWKWASFQSATSTLGVVVANRCGDESTIRSTNHECVSNKPQCRILSAIVTGAKPKADVISWYGTPDKVCLCILTLFSVNRSLCVFFFFFFCMQGYPVYHDPHHAETSSSINSVLVSSTPFPLQLRLHCKQNCARPFPTPYTQRWDGDLKRWP